MSAYCYLAKTNSVDNYVSVILKMVDKVSGVEAEKLDLSYSLFHSFFSKLFIIPYSVCSIFIIILYSDFIFSIILYSECLNPKYSLFILF